MAGPKPTKTPEIMHSSVDFGTEWQFQFGAKRAFISLEACWRYYEVSSVLGWKTPTTHHEGARLWLLNKKSLAIGIN
ncbi:hypothetical protein HG15A2_27920 [Adhaeretor mobilis]|uniref:Uncharacterized protein n=1 Tax=Adhaeretor mobilis TaxID=1930276 RepID=A0A517MX82_9BACT|nr:hypothetical protein HG15A2_27920 [Adhaeretor mobilis]